MPLVRASVLRLVSHDDRRAVGFWMVIDGKPTAGVRILVAYDTLWDMDKSELRDVGSALEICERERDKIEAAASKKFDAGAIDTGLHEGRPVVTVRTDDLD